MGQQAQNGGRRATLDDKKRRAAGRTKQDSPERRAIKESVGLVKHQEGRAGGAFGKKGLANRRGMGGIGEAGGGGGADAKSRHVNVGRSTRPARKS
ncbi:MAG TPA: hypothetical protein VGR35_03405 [Tepidisphaeraceae bacterium]|nr:hypothetical protein [Tepidisphaeraceae bacterium]